MPVTKLTQEIARNKETTEALLKRERELKKDIRKANIRAGATYERIDPNDPRHSLYGEGSEETRAQGSRTTPTQMHEYRGFKLIPMNQEPWHWTVESVGFPNPICLVGTFINVASAEEAINTYWKQEELKEGNNQ